MTLPRLAALEAEWRDAPPANVLLAARFGYKPPARPKKATRAALRQLMTKLGRR